LALPEARGRVPGQAAAARQRLHAQCAVLVRVAPLRDREQHGPDLPARRLLGIVRAPPPWPTPHRQPPARWAYRALKRPPMGAPRGLPHGLSASAIQKRSTTETGHGAQRGPTGRAESDGGERDGEERELAGSMATAASTTARGWRRSGRGRRPRARRRRRAEAAAASTVARSWRRSGRERRQRPGRRRGAWRWPGRERRPRARPQARRRGVGQRLRRADVQPLTRVAEVSGTSGRSGPRPRRG
jgi:hypothetical protein